MSSFPKLNDLSVIKPLGYHQNTSCGYCKKKDGSSSYYLSCEKMKADCYQELVDRGWRRSGTQYYKPDLKRGCCPHYTIRLDSASFTSKKDQRQAINRWNRFVLGAEYLAKAARLCPLSREEKKRKKCVFDLQAAVSASEYRTLQRPIDPRTKKAIEPAHKFEVTLESDAFTQEKFNIFLRYQLQVHKDPKSRWPRSSFTRFLCTGLDRTTVHGNSRKQKLGSYHQSYRLDGKLIAVGVLDLLPHCVSSVYLFYDPAYENWELGKLSALREIALTIQGQYQYYYMGFYIHSCIKMRYKGSYAPSYLLDPESLEWCVFDDNYRKKLDAQPYVSLSHEKATAGSGEADEVKVSPALAVDSPRSAPTTASTQAEVTDNTKSTISQPPTVDVDDLDLDSESSDDGTVVPEGSLFSYNVPGVLNPDEVERLDLNHWKLVVRNVLVEFEDLRGWEESSIMDPQSIKGIAGELAAVIGPKAMQMTAVSLF